MSATCRHLAVAWMITILLGAVSLAAEAAPKLYIDDVQFALEQLEAKCGHFFRVKEIDWRSVSRTFLSEAREVRTDEQHLVLLVRLLARLQDGHASVRPLPKGKDVQYPLAPKSRQTGPGMFWCRSGTKVLVKNSWSAAASAGIQPGLEIAGVDGVPIGKWLDAKLAERSDTMGFSTEHQAFYAACHWGLAGDQGSSMTVDLKDARGGRARVSVTRQRASTIPIGAVFSPKDLKTLGRQSYGKTPSGYGYIHLRDVPGELPTQLDTMLAEIGDVPGLILDCRANGGGGCDHDGVLGRFVPSGKELRRAGADPIPSAGPNPYGGPLVVIVDAGCRSAGETIAGMFKEDGRGYMIGESPTAGMSSQKTTIDLPSGLFSLYVSVRSNKQRFQNGRGIEGIGVIPHELVPYDQKDLLRQIDTQIRRAEEILQRFPQSKVPYKPEDYGWKPSR